MGCDRAARRVCKLHDSFNPRTHMGCDYAMFVCLYVNKCFNPRTHMGCDKYMVNTYRVRKSFNPRTHMGCDTTSQRQESSVQVSIHAPTWGATHYSCNKGTCMCVFQSTHPHGVRRHPQSTDFSYIQFQSTHPHGVRRNICNHTFSG